MSMIGLDTSTLQQNIQLIPREKCNAYKLYIEDEFTKDTTNVFILYSNYNNGFLNLRFDFSVQDKRRYKLTLKDEYNYIVWKGKAKGQ